MMSNTFLANRPDASAADNASHWQQLREEPTNGVLWLALAQRYAKRQLPWHLSYARTQAERCAQFDRVLVETLRKQALQLQCDPEPHWTTDEVLSQPRSYWEGREAVCADLRAHLAENPKDWLSWVFLARCLEMQEAVLSAPAVDTASLAMRRDAVRQALSCEVIAGETGHLLAQWRLRGGDLFGALNALQAVLQRVSHRHGSWLLSAEALMQLGREEEARFAFEQAGRSQNPRLLELLADKLFSFNFTTEALAVREVVVSLDPHYARGWQALGLLQKTLFQSGAARHSLQRALNLDESLVFAREGLQEIAQAGTTREEFDQRLLAFERGELGPNGEGMARLMMMSLYQSHINAERVASLHREVGEALQAQVNGHLSTLDGAPLWRRSEGRRLRVGYVSGDLHRQHPVNIFALPVLKRHDRSRLEVFVYHTGTFIDEYTREAKRSVDHWREVRHLSDKVLRSMIIDDSIDVLVDLAGHTATARLGVFAMRAAPAQMTYLGYPHSSGLNCIDWIIADNVVAPPEHKDLFSEQVARVSGCVFTWSPDDAAYPLPPQNLGAPDRPFTFGCFNNLSKVTDDVLAVWARVLHDAPGSRLLLKAPILGDLEVVRTTLRRLQHAGVDASRVQMRGPTELSRMMQEYADVDIALDPFPYNGGTTSLQALWMGCPMVAMEGSNFVSRMGMSFLTHLGRPEWIARDPDDYVRIAAGLANQIARQGWCRLAFREHMRASPLCNVMQQTRDIEDLCIAAHRAAQPLTA